MLRNVRNTRTLKENLMLASSTAFVSGLVNVAGLIAFFALSSNVTGHMANLVKHIADVDKHDLISLFIWLISFFSGAFVASYIIHSLQKISVYRAHATPIFIEAFILLLVAIYADAWYQGQYSQAIVACLLFSMGLQNGTVSKISGGLIKTTHLTGLMTDLGAETAEHWHPGVEKSVPLRDRLYVRLTILACYFIGGLIGALAYYQLELKIFYAVPLLLMTVLFYDLIPVARHRVWRAIRQRPGA